MTHAELRTPVLVGVAQVNQRTKDLAQAKEPCELMCDAVQQALEDTSKPKIVNGIGAIRVSRGVWPYENPAKFIAERFGLTNVETGLTVFGGNGVQTTVNLSCLDIQQGKFDAVAIVGAECGYTQANARRAGKQVEWRSIPGKPNWSIPSGIGVRHELETSRGIGGAVQIYAVFETALRHERGESVASHRRRVSDLWSRFNDVALKNPNAWIQDDLDSETISTVNSGNRAIAYPYPKLMNANNNVDQGAALILCSTEYAQRLGIPQSNWVYPWAGTDAHDTQVVSKRAKLTRAPGLRQAARRVLELAQVDLGDIQHVDLYSCFPSAVQVAALEIGLDETRPLTVTGGLTFGGGPLNNYVMHSIARMVEVLRQEPAHIGLVTANGGYLTKHAHGIYSTEPPQTPFQHEDVQDQVDTTGDRDVELSPQGAVTVEGYTVTYNREAPMRGMAACLCVDGRRTWGVTQDSDLLEEMISREFCGEQLHVKEDGTIRTA